jgi:hypothetical protein
MKTLLLAPVLLIILSSADGCNDEKITSPEFKGRLETKAICSNYTLKLLEGDMDTSLIVASWTDEVTNITHKNVFALSNPCTFPSTIQQGDEFRFVIDTTRQEECIVCMAYYPIPPKKLAIRVLDK